MNRWKEEIKLTDNLGLLYPEIGCWEDYDKNWDNYKKAWWLYYFCTEHLKQHFPQLENFMRHHLGYFWTAYQIQMGIGENVG